MSGSHDRYHNRVGVDIDSKSTLHELATVHATALSLSSFDAGELGTTDQIWGAQRVIIQLRSDTSRIFSEGAKLTTTIQGYDELSTPIVWGHAISTVQH